jgi:hypothetical protein
MRNSVRVLSSRWPPPCTQALSSTRQQRGTQPTFGVLVDEGLLGSFLWYRGSASAGFGIGFKGLYKSLNLQIVSGCAGLLPAKAVLLPSQAGSTTAYICAG